MKHYSIPKNTCEWDDKLGLALGSSCSSAEVYRDTQDMKQYFRLIVDLCGRFAKFLQARKTR